MKIINTTFVLLILLLGLGFTSSHAAFVNDIALMNVVGERITFNEYDILAAIGPGDTAVPGQPKVTLSSSVAFQVGDLNGSTLHDRQVTGLFEDYAIFQPLGSTASGSFFVDFDTPVSEVGLAVLNNFGTEERFYNVRIFDSGDNLLEEQLNVPVIAEAEFLGFVTATANIARFELNFGPTKNTRQRPLIDTIAFYDNSIPPIPIPAAVWLFGSALMGMVGIARRTRKTS